MKHTTRGPVRRAASVAELTKRNVETIAKIEKASESQRTFGERAADSFAAAVGSWTFLIIQTVIFALWVVLNLVAWVEHWDPYPFILLNLVLSTLAALQAPVIMMSQNRQSQKDRLKADLDYEVNLKAELEIAQLHNKLDRLYEAMQAHFAMHEKKLSGIINASSAGSGS